MRHPGPLSNIILPATCQFDRLPREAQVVGESRSGFDPGKWQDKILARLNWPPAASQTMEILARPDVLFRGVGFCGL